MLLLSNQHKTLDSLERMLFLLSSDFHLVATVLTKPMLKQIRTRWQYVGAMDA